MFYLRSDVLLKFGIGPSIIDPTNVTSLLPFGLWQPTVEYQTSTDTTKPFDYFTSIMFVGKDLANVSNDALEKIDTTIL